MEEFSDIRFKQLVVIELLTAEKVPLIETYRRMQAVVQKALYTARYVEVFPV